MLGWLASLVGLLSLDLGQVSWLAIAAALVAARHRRQPHLVYR